MLIVIIKDSCLKGIGEPFNGLGNNQSPPTHAVKLSYVAKSDATGWATTTVKLSGKTNSKQITDDTTAPKISLTWSVVKKEAEATTVALSVSVTTATYSVANGAKITVSLGAGDEAATGIADVLYSKTEDGTYASIGDKGSYKDGKVELAGGMFNSDVGQSRYIKIKFNDTKNTTSGVIKLTVAE